MMNDWTDIIGKQLGSLNEPLPADDWNVIQQKYSTRQRARRAAAWRWTSSIAATAAAVLLIFFISKPEETVPHSNLIAEEISHTEEIIPDSYTPDPDSYTPASGKPADEEPAEDKRKSGHAGTAAMKPAEEKPESPEPATVAKSEVGSDEGSEEGSETESEIAPVHTQSSANDEASVDKKGETGKEYKYLALDDLLEEPEQDKTRRKITIGISAAISSTMDMGGKGEINYCGPVESPSDSSYYKNAAATKSLRNDFNFDKYDHEMPVSYGISARVNLNGVLAVSTGINYTRYESKRTNYTQGYTRSSTQNVHYIGIPVRFDLILADSKNLSLYLGAGMQVDKCLWAKAWGETLHEKEFLWSVTCAGGLQVNLSPTAALYLEPEISRALNTGSLQTYRTEENSTICLRAGLRFTLK